MPENSFLIQKVTNMPGDHTYNTTRVVAGK